ncbi:MAG: WYL domain-containing protein [Clostridia bacterium]|nr:WYL domain-containing protein [Clostridia bacterium]
MKNASGQKLKLLYLYRFLLRESDEEHPVTIGDMVRELNAYGISADRRTLYDDLGLLELFGVDIVKNNSGRNTSYYVGERDFQEAELKILSDAVQASNFLTPAKTDELISKLKKTASVHQAKKLERQMHMIGDASKQRNESVYYSVDSISDAIDRRHKIRFQYFHYNMQGEKILRHDGKIYQVSPFAFFSADQNYYLIAYDTSQQKILHFRVDRMIRVTELEEEREGDSAFNALDIRQYASKVFSMFAGEEHYVTMRFSSELTDSVFDRFGSSDTVLVPDGTDHFIVKKKIAVSPQFFAWIFGFGNRAEILAPEQARKGFSEMLSEISGLYSDSQEQKKGS